MDLKKPLTYDEQIIKLENHGLIITDKIFAKKVLSTLNYYRFAGYIFQFKTANTDPQYKSGITFEQIYKIYKFDEALRHILRKYIEIAEVYYRTQISYVFSHAKCTESPYNQHYDETNFYNKNGYNEVLNNIEKEKGHYRDSLVVKHHKKKYSGKMPLWVIVEIMSLSNISKLYSCMYYSEQNAIASEVGTSRSVLINHLHCISVLRNKCAHAARLYNTVFNPPAKLPPSFLKRHPAFKNNTFFAYILILVQRLPDIVSKMQFCCDLNTVIEYYSEDIDLSLIGFLPGYELILTEFI